jgi:superfamily I DNA/RNA helicase
MIRPDEWRPVAGTVLEPNARATAIMTVGNAVVTAGPGAGKTELLAQRADFLLRTGTCRYPRRILAICFKVDAAGNLRDRIRTRSGDRYAARLDSLTFHAFAKRLVDNYRPALTGKQALPADYRIVRKDPVAGEEITFDELIPRALTILKTNPYALRALRQTFSHVFLDEFQDATEPQYDLLKIAFHGTDTSVVAVGDVKQRIMVWAGALDGVFERFADDFHAAPRSLYQNFRSAPGLRRMQNRMILEMDPEAASPPEDLVGDAGRVEVLPADTHADEAEAIASRIDQWLANGVPPAEIAVLVRQYAGPVTTDLRAQLQDRGIPYRDEQAAQDLTAEPIGSLIFNFIRVVAEDRQPAAYTELMRLVRSSSVLEETATRFDRSAKRLIQACRAQVREPDFQPELPESWRPLIDRFLVLVSRPTLVAMSTGYQQGSRLDELVEDAMLAFGKELETDGDPSAALRRLSETDAVRILTVHKCKGLEFEKVVVLGVEREFYWSDDSMSVFFVAISRAKDELILTHVNERVRPPVELTRWDEHRRPHTRLLGFAYEA